MLETIKNLEIDNEAKMKLVRLYAAAHALYFAGVWNCETIPTDDQVKLWESLRDGLGLQPGSWTNYLASIERK